MEKITGFPRKDCLSLPGVGWKYFENLGTEEEQPSYTYNDKYMRWFVRQSVEGGRVCSFNQFCKSKICDDIVRIISEELNVNGNIYDIIQAYLNYKNTLFKIIEREYDNQIIVYRDEDVEDEEKIINEKLSGLLIHQLMKQIKLDELLWDFDAVSLYPLAMWDVNSIYPRIETGYAYTEDMSDELLHKEVL